MPKYDLNCPCVGNLPMSTIADISWTADSIPMPGMLSSSLISSVMIMESSSFLSMSLHLVVRYT